MKMFLFLNFHLFSSAEKNVFPLGANNIFQLFEVVEESLDTFLVVSSPKGRVVGKLVEDGSMGSLLFTMKMKLPALLWKEAPP